MRPLHTSEASRVQFGLPDNLFAVDEPVAKKKPLPLADGYKNDTSSAAFNPIEFMLEEGVTEPERIWERQAFVADYQRIEAEPELATDMAAVMDFADRHRWLRERVRDEVRSKALKTIVFTPRIELLLRSGERAAVKAKVAALVAAKKRSKQAAVDYAGANPATPLGTVAREVASTLQSLPKFTVAKYVEQRGSYDIPAWRNVEQLTKDHYSMIELANRVQELNMTQGVVGTALSQPLIFERLRQLRFDQPPQSPISLTLGNQAVALTGRNGAGKTFAVEAIIEAMLTTTSVGYASGRVHTPPIRSIDMLVRPAGGNGNFSAFGVEVQRWAELLERLEAPSAEKGVKVVVSDEPFSSTDTEGQAELLNAVLFRLRELGARAIITTHADLSAEGKSIDVYHVGKNHQIEHGVGDADSLTVAREHGLPDDIVMRAHELMNGEAPVLVCGETNQLQTWTPREYYGEASAGLNWLYNQRPAEQPLSHKERRSYYCSTEPYMRPPQYNTVIMLGKKDQIMSGYWGAGDWHGRAIADMVQSASSSAEVIAARNEFITALANYESLGEFETTLANFRTLYRGLCAKRGEHPRYEGRLAPELANPLNDVGACIRAMLSTTQRHTENVALHYLTEDKHRQLHAQYQPQIFDVFRELASLGSDERAKQLFENYLGVYMAATSALQADSFSTEELRQTCYAYLEEVDSSKQGSKKARKLLRREFDEIFVEWQEYDDDDKLLWPPIKTDRWRESINRYQVQKILRELVIESQPWNTGSIRAEIIQRAFADVTVDTLADSADCWDKLSAVCKDFTKRGITTAIAPAAAVLAWVANDTDPVEAIANHLHEIGGTIAVDLAKHFETTVAAYFDGSSRASKAVKRIQKSQNEPYDDSVWHISHQPLDASSGYGTTPFIEAWEIANLVGVARRLTGSEYQPVAWGDAPQFKDAKPLIKPDLLKPFTLQHQYKGGIEILTGANGSGKTEALRTMFATVASAQSTGFVPGEAVLPIYDKIIYLDRPLYDTAEGKSSFTADVAHWKSVFSALEQAAPSIVFADEPFSTVPAKYQEALILSVSEWLARRGHRFVMATHNHSAAQRIHSAAASENSVEVGMHYFETVISKNGKISYNYDLCNGHAPSRAIAVARTVGGEAMRRALDGMLQL